MLYISALKYIISAKIVALLGLYSVPNFVKILCQIKKFSIEEVYFDCSVCMAAICYSGPLSAVPTNVQLLGEKRTCVKFMIDISKTERLVCVYTEINSAHHVNHLCIDFIESKAFTSGVTNFVANLIYPVQCIKMYFSYVAAKVLFH